jgi:hypothetical protein
MLKTYTTPMLVAKGSAVQLTKATEVGSFPDLSGEPPIDRYEKVGSLL